jgi:hypothetical protein
MIKIKLLLVFVMISGVMLAQSGKAPLSQGESQLNFGLGFNSEGFPMYGGIEFAVHDDVTIGPQVNIVLDDDDARISFHAKGDYHFNRLLDVSDEWDVYAGANAGINVGDGDVLQLGIQMGGRWYWSDKWGINLEFGGGNTFHTTLGVSMKL